MSFNPLLYLLCLVRLVPYISALHVATRDSAEYKTLIVQTTGNVTRVTFNHPPINLVDAPLLSDLLTFLTSIQPSNRTTPPPKVVIFDSANPDYFLGPIDITALQEPLTPAKTALTETYVTVLDLFSSITSTVFIAEVNGRAFGAGQEMSVQMDMRFAGPNARTGSFENAIGVVAGGGGQLFLATLMNRALALEYLLASKTFDGPTGKALGLFNNYWDSAAELKSQVDALAARIGLFPAGGLNETKAALSFRNPTPELLSADVVAFGALDVQPEVQAKIGKFLDLDKQTNTAFDLGLTDSVLDLYE